ncbi:hypothetical protein D3871_17660 [Noviherbaspirillum saxi]|uniref:Uncharacterized protein n=2 Tax=Noviherbaspirillum saxi TaxID=2320863 RepID=A0A3A3FJ09_9BURK|nr:hypothetical protein D3871_17660 [Noviherbaspirillum saxi]
MLICAAVVLTGCTRVTVTTGSSISNEDLEAFFHKHKVDGNYAAALKKSAAGVASYLATIHGYRDNMAVCKSLIEPYNKDPSLSAISGTYYCQELR